MALEKLWTLKELAEKGEPQISISTWRRMIRAKKVFAVRVGSGRGIWYVKNSEVERLANHEQD